MALDTNVKSSIEFLNKTLSKIIDNWEPLKYKTLMKLIYEYTILKTNTTPRNKTLKKYQKALEEEGIFLAIEDIRQMLKILRLFWNIHWVLHNLHNSGIQIKVVWDKWEIFGSYYGLDWWF